MYGKLNDVENFAEKFEGTILEEYGDRLDGIVEMYQDNNISKDEAAELLQDIKLEAEIDKEVGQMQLKSDFIKAADLLLKVL